MAVNFSRLAPSQAQNLVIALTMPKLIKYCRESMYWGFTLNKLAFVTKCVVEYYNKKATSKVRQAYHSSSYALSPGMLAKKVVDRV